MSDPYDRGGEAAVPGSKIKNVDLEDIDVIEGDELEQLQAELFEEANLIAEDDYYAILNVTKDVRWQREWS